MRGVGEDCCLIEGSDSESSFASGEEDGWSEISVKQIKWAQDSIKAGQRIHMI